MQTYYTCCFHKSCLLFVIPIGSFLSPSDTLLSVEGNPVYCNVATGLEEGGLSEKSTENQNFVVCVMQI